MRVVMQATTGDYKTGETNKHFLVALADINVVRLKKPTYNSFLVAYLFIVDAILEKISFVELSSYAVYLPVFRVNLELDNGENDVINKQYDTPLASLYSLTRKSLIESAEQLFLSLSKEYLLHHNIGEK